MLYDVLIIDDVLGESFVDQESVNASDFEGRFFDFIHCQKFINNLIRDRLRVTWTTGELDDLVKLRVPELSAIQHIFLDLHLTGISENNSYKDINAKILGIFAKIDAFLGLDKVTCYLNSKYRSSRSYAEDGKKDLEDKFYKEFGCKYSIQIMEEKNSLSNRQKNDLADYSLRLYARNLIINKAAHVESIFDDKLELSGSAIEKLDFHDKFLVFQSQFLAKYKEDKLLKSQIQLLQQIRNILAHNDNDLYDTDIRDDKNGTLLKTFWQVSVDKSMQIQETSKGRVDFINFDHLAYYILSIDNLCQSLKDATLQLKRDS